MHLTAHDELQLFALLLAFGVVLVVAARSRLPVSVFLVTGGLLLGFMPGLPDVQLPPDLVLVGILPPLLYSSAFFTGLRDLRANLRPISLLAFVLENPMATILPEGTVRREIAAGLLRACRIVEPKLQRKLYVIYSNERPLSAAESDFVRLLRSATDPKDPSTDEVGPASASGSGRRA